MKTLIVAMLATLAAALTAHAQNPNGPRVDRREEGRQSNTKEQRIADWLTRLDSNEDGKISPNESSGPMKANFDRIDAKGDGSIDQQELGALADRLSENAPRSPRANALPEPDHADVTYGSHDRCVMDIWLGKGDDKSPAVIFVHGGGFVNGDKRRALPAADFAEFHEKGVAGVSINYPFKNQVPWPEVFPQAARAIQFLRHHADRYKIDEKRIAMYGNSAGAGITLWAAFHDDLADPQSTDPVARESSKPTCGVGLASQATYDQLKWHKIIGVEEAAVIAVRNREGFASSLGIDVSELTGEKGAALRKRIDMLEMIDENDPPVMLVNLRPNVLPGDIIHHPRFSIAIKKRCDSVGAPCQVVLQDTPANERLEHVAFIAAQLVKDATASDGS